MNLGTWHSQPFQKLTLKIFDRPVRVVHPKELNFEGVLARGRFLFVVEGLGRVLHVLPLLSSCCPIEFHFHVVASKIGGRGVLA